MSSDLTLRPATTGDLPGIAALYQRARSAAVPQMPPAVHSPSQIHDWVTTWDLTSREVWVAEAVGLRGFLTLTGAWLDSLYVVPTAQRTGVGSALIEVAQSLRPKGFALWVFESNMPAREFYRRHGLVELEQTDGVENEERSPDIRMAWPGTDPVAFLRGQIDEVDQDLARLLARRVALTAAVQAYKPVGGLQGRDPAREREIAERMSEQAPVLGTDRLARIVHAIITESLEAAAENSR